MLKKLKSNKISKINLLDNKIKERRQSIFTCLLKLFQIHLIYNESMKTHDITTKINIIIINCEDHLAQLERRKYERFRKNE